MDQKTKKFSCQGYKGIKLTAVILACATLSGCSVPAQSVSAGTAVSEITDMSSARFGSVATTEWMSDKGLQTADIKVSVYTDKRPDIDIDPYIASLIPKDEVCTLNYFNISSDRYDFPVKVTDYNGKKFEFNGTEFDTAVYPLGNGWYCFNMPNSCSSCQIKVGNIYFK